ncbi:murein L,D-transpeptidase [Pedobacter fastidiosus]|uniref:L,D-transpeptidase family protein n=1 Tax=Pedobacter fastidiosus TaxID=2765361 RepID=A0ABR7KS81_9SPHI|nr:L,D-transpeptidase family protein [Pedobacter fastidiosus]MBC6110955.1 L,D-transpeptidase family protein [Pedobacter fastidiosus]
MNLKAYRLLKCLYKILLPAILISSMLTCRAQQKKKHVSSDSLSIAGKFSDQKFDVFDSLGVETFFLRFPELAAYQPALRNFYRKRKFAYAWYNKERLTFQAHTLSNRVLNISEEGIYRMPPYSRILDSLVNSPIEVLKKPQMDPTTELMLTAQYFLFSKLAWHGQDDSLSSTAGWFIPRKKLAYAKILDSLLNEKDSKEVFHEPVYRQYELLKSFLKKYRNLSSQDWPTLLDSLRPLKPGDSAQVIAQIRLRLFKLGDHNGDTVSTRYDQELIDGLEHFQQRHGLKEDGLLGPDTFAQLNVPLAQRIKQIIVNMERCRWLPVRSDADYLAVNIPEYKLHVYHRDSLLWSCNVVVGQSWSRTTVFFGDLKHIVFSPYWNLPESIVKKEVLPGIQKDPAYLAKHDMEITAYNGKIPVVRQRPGKRNSLGLVKFIFPNSYSIYMHDTPSKSLFGETERAFSHGCIRVMEPVKLAEFLLGNQREWTNKRIAIAMNSGRERYVPMKKQVPVYIAYLTAFCDRDNVLNFRNDIYHLDEAMAATLISGL